jgi:autotransporter translocation and assembly factor TamB
MSTGRRALALALLLALTLGVCVQYDRADTDRWAYPSQEALNAGLDRYDGQEVMLFVTIADVDRETGRVTDEELAFAVDIAGVDGSVADRLEAGGEIQVSGTVDADENTVTAERVVIDYQNSGDWVYLAGTSMLGVMLALGHLLRYWWPDFSTLSLEPRGERRG